MPPIPRPEADSPFASATEIFFKSIKVEKNQSATFSGGGPFHIDTLDVKKDAILNMAAGTYFIDTLNIDKNTVLNVTSAPVILHIGDKAAIEKDVVSNAGGTVDGLRVFAHANAEFKGDKNLAFTGLIYGPATKKVEIKKDTVFHGAIITGGEIKLDKDIVLTYTVSDQAAVSAVRADAGAGDSIPPVVTASANSTVAAVDANGTPTSDPAIQAFLNGASALDDVDGPLTPTNNV